MFLISIVCDVMLLLLFLFYFVITIIYNCLRTESSYTEVILLSTFSGIASSPWFRHLTYYVWYYTFSGQI